MKATALRISVSPTLKAKKPSNIIVNQKNDYLFVNLYRSPN